MDLLYMTGGYENHYYIIKNGMKNFGQKKTTFRPVY